MRRMCLWCLITTRKEIIMQISVCPNRRTNINSKNGRKSSFSFETKASIHLSQCGEWICGAQSLKERRLLRKSEFIQLKKELYSKNRGKRCFSYETRASIPFILVRRMNLWHPIIKRKEIIMWIRVYPIENRILILKILQRVMFPMKPKPQYHLSQ